MATFLDITLFSYFNIVFIFLLISLMIFALLHKFKVLGGMVLIDSIISVIVGFLSILSETVMSLINFMAPWFVVVFLFGILLLITYKLFGASDSDIANALKNDKTIQWAIFGVCLVIILAAFGVTLGQKMIPLTSGTSNATTTTSSTGVATNNWETNIWGSLFSSKILGFIVIFLIAIFTIAFLTGGP